jgi:hypothetical protein
MSEARSGPGQPRAAAHTLRRAIPGLWILGTAHQEVAAAELHVGVRLRNPPLPLGRWAAGALGAGRWPVAVDGWRLTASAAVSGAALGLWNARELRRHLSAGLYRLTR